MPDEISTKRKKKNVTDRMVDKTPGIQEDRIGYQIRDDINAFVDPLKQELNDYRNNVRDELEIPTNTRPVQPSRMDLPYQETTVDRIRAMEGESPLDVARIETGIAKTPNTLTGTETATTAAVVQEEEPIRTASTAIKNIQDAEAAVSTARPAAVQTEPAAAQPSPGEFDAKSVMALPPFAIKLLKRA